MLEYMRACLDTTGYEWAFAAWSHAPSGDYGVYSLNDQSQFRAESDSAAETMLQGFVDYFTRDRSRAPQIAIEKVLRDMGLVWELNSIQFEEDTGYMHYEWTWSDPLGNDDAYVITFKTLDGDIIVPAHRGQYPEPPSVGVHYDGDFFYEFFAWDAPIEEATDDATYTASYRIITFLIVDDEYHVRNFSTPGGNGYPEQDENFTQEQFDRLTEMFENGQAISAYLKWSFAEDDRYDVVEMNGREGVLWYSDEPFACVFDISL